MLARTILVVGLLSALACARDAQPTPGAAGAAAATPAASLEVDGLPAGPYPDGDPALAKQLVDGGALLLDVRTPAEFELHHIDGAINIDHNEVSARLDEIRSLADGDTHKPVVLYCKSGRRAGIVKKQLLGAGFDRVTNLGSYADWRQ